ncbi:MAG: hypothetical protein WDA53_02645 [Bacillota bacterium]
MYYNRPLTSEMEELTQEIRQEIKDEIIREFWLRQRDNQMLGANREQAINTVTTENYQQAVNPYIITEPAKTKGSEFLYGVGAVAVLGMLLPNFRRKIGTAMGRTATEGAELLEKARSMIARAKEDMEDLIAEASFNEATKRPK